MSKNMNFVDVQKMLMQFALTHGLSEKTVHEDWSFDYRSDVQKTFVNEMDDLMKAMALFKMAHAQSDPITARCAVVDAIIKAGQLRDFFAALDTDLKHVLCDFERAVIPDSYVIPERYGYRNN